MNDDDLASELTEPLSLQHSPQIDRIVDCLLQDRGDRCPCGDKPTSANNADLPAAASTTYSAENTVQAPVSATETQCTG